MKLNQLPMQSSALSKDFAKDLENIEQTASKNKHAQAYFAREQGLVAVLLKDEHCIFSKNNRPDNKPAFIKVDLKRCWYRGKPKFRKGDRILLVASSHAEKGTVLELAGLADPFSFLRFQLPSRMRWRCLIREDLDIPYEN